MVSTPPTTRPFTPTPEQQRIINHTRNRHGRILAGPGTGKSATLVALVERLLAEEDPPRLKLLTFTRAATAELGHKVSQHPTAATLRPSTIHSFAISALLRNPGTGGFPEPLRIPDSWEYDNIIRPGLARRAGTTVRKLDILVREMAANWESLTTPGEDARISKQERTRFLGAWSEHREVYGYTLLAELPYALRRALHDHDDLDGLDYDILLVDEYQDLNACDLEVLRLLAERGCSIIAAGDDEQSIYSFRKAAPEGIRRFSKDYPGSADYPLSLTQRCGQRIVEWANHVILGDPDRLPNRSPLTPLPQAPDGEAALLCFRGETSEAKGVATIVQGLIAEGLAPSDILILVRTDHNRTFSTPIKEQLTERGIATSDPDGVERILEEPSNRLLLALMRILCHREDSIAWATLLKLSTGIGARFSDHIYGRCVENRSHFGAELLTAHTADFPGAPHASATKAMKLIQEVVSWLDAHPLPEGMPEDGWGQWVLSISGMPPAPAPTEDLRALFSHLDALSEPDQTLPRYLAQIEPLGKDRAQARSDTVRVMTMTASKGLTVRAVILAGLEEGLVPRPEGQLAEERRILYVAMTRAREFLFGTWASRRRGPTARAGIPSSNRRRQSTFLEGGPVISQPGDAFLRSRFSHQTEAG